MAVKQKDLSIEFTQEIVEWMHDDLDLTYSEIASAADADRSTLRRWLNAESAPSKTHYRNIMTLQRIQKLMKQSFPDQETRRRWLHMPLEGTSGKSPLQCFQNSELKPVVKVLASGVSGAFS